MNNKKSFILYTDVYDSIKELSIGDKAQLLDAIYQYVIEDKVPNLTPISKMAFSFIKREIDRNDDKWESIRERNVENGKKGGRPKNPEEPKKPTGLSGNPKNPVTVTVNATVTDNVNVNEEEQIKLPQKKINPLALTRGQIISYMKAIPNITQSEVQEQAKLCNNYMGMSSWDIKDPGIFFRKWLTRYMSEKKTKLIQEKKIEEQNKYMPDLTDEERERNFKKIAEIRKEVISKL